jgi:hypothetical protein
MAGLAALDSDAGLRERMSAAGRLQAEKFSVARYQERLARLYEGLASERAARQVLAKGNGAARPAWEKLSDATA